MDSETELRTANAIVAQASDHLSWAPMADLFNERDWTMDDALYEFTHVRQDMAGVYN